MSDLLIQSGDTLLDSSLPAEGAPASSFDFLQILRFLFYLLVVMKLIELSFLRRKKHSLKERVYRKFLFAHQELLKQFTEEDKTVMEQTLTNTIKNATVESRGTRNKPKHKKRVNFSTEKNSYYDPKQWRSEDDEDEYLDVEVNSHFETAKEGAVRDKMIEEEFGERQNLEKINEKEEEIEIEASKLTQDTQISSEAGVSQVSDLPIEARDSLLLSSREPPQGENAEVAPPAQASFKKSE